MAAQLSKAGQIRKLLQFADLDIAQRVGCAESYVRTVRQRTSADGCAQHSPGDRKWHPMHWGYRRERYASDPGYRERRRNINARSAAKRRAEARAS